MSQVIDLKVLTKISAYPVGEVRIFFKALF